MHGIALVLLLGAAAYAETRQEALTLFQDCIENSTPGARPGETDPGIGTYKSTSSGCTV